MQFTWTCNQSPWLFLFCEQHSMFNKPASSPPALWPCRATWSHPLHHPPAVTTATFPFCNFNFSTSCKQMHNAFKPSSTALFHLAVCPPETSMLLHIPQFLSFFQALWDSTLDSAVCLSIHEHRASFHALVANNPLICMGWQVSHQYPF